MEKIYLLVAGGTAALFLFWGINLLIHRKGDAMSSACDALGVVSLFWAALFFKDCVNLALGNPVQWGQISSALDFMAVPITSIYLFGLCRPQWVIRRCLTALSFYVIPCAGLFVWMMLSERYSRICFILLLVLAAVYSLIMLAFIIHSIHTYHRYLRENFSYDDRMNLRWVVYASALFFLNCLLYFLSYLADWWDIVYYVSIVLIWWILYRHTVRQRYVPVGSGSGLPRTADGAKQDEGGLAEFAEENMLPDYANVRMDVLEEIGSKIEATMQSESLYLDPELNLSMLASRAGTNKTYVYQYLKYCKKVSFLDYVNNMRIEKKEVPMLEEEKVYTINEIAYASGFQSTATFRRAFAKKCGCAPSQYKGKVAGSERKA